MAGRTRSRSPRRSWRQTSQAEREAGSEMLKHLLRAYSCCKLSAKDLCIACHHAAAANVPGGAFGLYAVDPDADSGRFQRHLDTVLPGPGPLFMVATPQNPSRSTQRVVRDLPMRALW
eukprot:2664796-Pyramimonas_sp.AAC.1